jgi:uncharacterized membrane protein
MNKNPRLYFIDALRAFAIIMMLQGHFISGLLDPSFKDPSNPFYNFWLYCRGFTAPIFFTITGWIFTFLLLKNPVQGWGNPRIKKGIKRGIELIIWGYLLRLNLPMLFKGHINHSFYYPDVLHIIGLSLLFILFCYLLFGQLKRWLGFLFLLMGILIFLGQPLYVDLEFSHLPNFLAAYLTKANKGVFYLFPWLGYVSIGAFIATVFNPKTNRLWGWSLGFILMGLTLIYYSSSLFIQMEQYSGISLFRRVAYNNFLFIRLGDVLLLFGGFMLLNRYLSRSLFTKIGSKTLEIYIVHYFIFYVSLFGIGLFKYFSYSWSFSMSICGAFIFIIACVGLVILDDRYRTPTIRYILRRLTLK